MNKALALSMLGVVVAASLTSCSGGGGGAGQQILLGTTDTVSSLDPAKGYGSGDQAVMNALYQGVMYTPPGKTEPEPQLAQSCSFADPTTYTCKIKSGQKFSNGDALTAQDVAYSLNRVVSINDPTGGAYLLDSLDRAEATSDQDVTFKLKRPNEAWPKILAGPMSYVVPRGVFPADKLLEDGSTVVGSGAYQMDTFKPGEIISLKPNANYAGEPALNDGIIFRYFQTPSALRLAFDNGDVDTAIAWRSLTTSDVKAMGDKPGVQTIQLPGIDGRYIAFNVDLPPVSQTAIRKSAAALIDRDTLADVVLGGGVEPMYSITPAGTAPGGTQPFTEYAAPNPQEAARLLRDAGVLTPVPLTLWYTPSRWGGTAGDEMTEISRQLNASKLFDVKLSSSEWEQYNGATSDGSYEMYFAAWYPDYADPDNFLQGLLGGGWSTNYANPTVTADLAAEQASTDVEERTRLFAAIEQQAAQDAPVIPLYQSNYTMLASEGVTGIRESSNILFALNYAQWEKK